jgi:Derlin-2/3
MIRGAIFMVALLASSVGGVVNSPMHGLRMNRATVNAADETRGVLTGGQKHRALVKILTLRAGKRQAELDDALLGDLDDDDDDDFDFDEGATGAVKDNAILASIRGLWSKTPPISQVYVGASILITVLCFALNKNQWPEFFNLEWNAVLTKFQFWRIPTSFLYLGPLGLNYILTIQFVWTYMAQLERLNYHEPEQFLMMLLFGATTLMVGYFWLGFSPKFLGHNLSTYLVYIWAKIFEGTDVNIMDLFLLKAEVLPWFFCAQTYLLEGEIPYADILGIVVGHLYHYLNLKKMVQAPAFIRAFFQTPTMKASYLKFKEDFE